MDKVTKIKIKIGQNSYTDPIPIGANAENVVMSNGETLQTVIGGVSATSDGSIKQQLDGLKYAIGGPTAVSTVAEMNEDTEKVYLYVGNETGYTYGNWYYYDGSNWTSGGQYLSNIVTIDDTLSTQGEAADAAAVGTALSNLEVTIDDELSTTSTNPVQNKVITEQVNDLKSALDELGYAENDITVTQGTAHTSQSDLFALNIKNGQKCRIKGTSSSYSGTLVVRVYGFTSESDTTGTIIANSLSIGINGSAEFTSNGNYALIGLYWNTSWMTSSGTVHFRIDAPDSALWRLENVETLADGNSTSIANIQNLEMDLISYSKTASDWHSGTIDPTTGENSGTSSKRIRLNGYIGIDGIETIYIACITGICCGLFFYESDNTYISWSYWKYNEGVDIPQNAAYIRISVKYIDGDTAISTSDVAGGLFTLGNYFPLIELGEMVSNIPGYVYDTVDIKDGSEDIAATKTALAGLISEIGNPSEVYMFVTDPHPYYIADNPARIKRFYATLANSIAQMPFEFVLSGGDWLTDGMTQTEACEALGYITGVMEKMSGGKYYPMLGNHDMNIFGDEGDPELSYGAIINTMFPKQGSAYYHFDTKNTSYYVIDTGSDHNTSIDAYRTEQLKWLADALTHDTAAHIAILEHIYCVTTITNVYHVAAQVNNIIAAYNSRASITIDGTTYSYASATGRIEYVLAGHAHAELSGYANGVPVIVCNRALTASVIGYDIVMVDYEAREINLLRSNTNQVRTIALDEPET